MHFVDMGTVTQISQGPHVRAVGWLDAAHPFPTGTVEPEVVARIRAFAKAWVASVKALGWPVAAGPHTCDFCGRVRASGNFGVPHGDILFVCPEMIAHYVEDHGYLPPSEFLVAVMAAEMPGTDAYASSVATFANGGNR
jgi:hypothetical protein